MGRRPHLQTQRSPARIRHAKPSLPRHLRRPSQATAPLPRPPRTRPWRKARLQRHCRQAQAGSPSRRHLRRPHCRLPGGPRTLRQHQHQQQQRPRPRRRAARLRRLRHLHRRQRKRPLLLRRRPRRRPHRRQHQPRRRLPRRLRRRLHRAARERGRLRLLLPPGARPRGRRHRREARGKGRPRLRFHPAERARGLPRLRLRPPALGRRPSPRPRAWMAHSPRRGPLAPSSGCPR